MEGAGELPDLPLVIAEESRRRAQAFPAWVPAMQAADWRRLGQRYLERTAHWTARRPRFTDKLPNNWYYFGSNGDMATGWFKDNLNNWYYLTPAGAGTEGAMVTGWQQIDGRWYYFNEKSDGFCGTMLSNTTTPDGYTVDGSGAWIQ